MATTRRFWQQQSATLINVSRKLWRVGSRNPNEKIKHELIEMSDRLAELSQECSVEGDRLRKR